MAVPLPNQIPHPSKSVALVPKKPRVSSPRRSAPETQSQKENSVSSGPGPRKSSPSKTNSSGISDKAPVHTTRERTDEDTTLDPFICSCGESFVSENDAYRHVKSKKPVFVRTDHLNDKPLRGHEGLQALKNSLEGERKRPRNTTRQPRRSK